MNFINRVTWRRLMPAGVVAAALAIAYLAPLPAEASKTNNCGVKGGYAYGGYAFAFHDHGKPCPNRPFPGKGKGVLKFLVSGTTPAITVSNPHSSSKTIKTSSPDNETAPVAVAAVTQSVSKSHGHGKGHGRGKKDLTD